MSLQFICGNSGSGKSHRLYRNITEQSVRHPERNYIVLVPQIFPIDSTYITTLSNSVRQIIFSPLYGKVSLSSKKSPLE